MEPVVGELLGGLAVNIVVGAASEVWRRTLGKSEKKALGDLVRTALIQAVDHAKWPDVPADPEWGQVVATELSDVFDGDVSYALLASLNAPDDDIDSHQAFTAKAWNALERKRDLESLGKALDIEEFLWRLPRCLLEELGGRAYADKALGSLLHTHVLNRDLRRGRPAELSPRELREEVMELLRQIEHHAHREGLPRYLPPDCDITRMQRTVRIRRDLHRRRDTSEETDERTVDRTTRAYGPKHERDQSTSPPLPWLEFVRTSPRIVVLADPGLGKSWLVRTETLRLARVALEALDAGARLDQIVVPVSARCDELLRGHDRSEQQSLAELLGHAVGRRLQLSPRVREWLVERIEAGTSAILLDALDEVPSDLLPRLKPLLRALPDTAEDRLAGAAPRCVITTRIAGYVGPPMPSADEVELLPFEPADVEALVATWELPGDQEQQTRARRQLREKLREPAVAQMARIPLLLALLCWIAGDKGPLPSLRWELYDQVVNKFLAIDRATPDTGGRPTTRIQQFLRVLRPTAMHFADQDGGWVDLMDPDELATALEAADGTKSLGRDGLTIVNVLAVDAGLLVPDGSQVDGQNPPYRFVHRTVAEFLVSRHLVGMPEHEWLAVVDKHLWFDADWAEVIPMLGSQLADPGPLVDHLLDLPDDPFHIGLRTAARVLAELPEASMRKLPDHVERVVERLLALTRPWNGPAEKATTTALAALTPRVPTPLLTYLVDQLRRADGLRALSLGRVLTARDFGPSDHDEQRHELLGLLTNDSIRHRQAAVLALAGTADHPEVRAAFLHLLPYDDSEVRAEAVRALGAEIGDRKIRDVLLDRLREDRVAEVRDAAAGALLGALDHDEVKAAAVQLVRSDDHEVREAALQAVAAYTDDRRVRSALWDRVLDDRFPRTPADVLASRLDSDPARKAFVELFSSRSERQRRTARTTVEELSRQDEQFLQGLLDLLRDHPAARVRRSVELASADGTAPGDARRTLRDLLTDDFDLNRHYAAPGELTGPAHRSPPHAALLELLRTSREPRRRVAAVEALTDSAGHPDVWGTLLERLGDDDIGSAVKSALGEVVDQPEVRDALLDRLGDADDDVRAAAVSVLGRIADQPDVWTALLGRLADHRVQFVIPWALRKAVDQPRLRRALLGRLDDPDGRARGAAVHALHGAADDPDVRAALIGRLADTADDVRRAAASALDDVIDQPEVRGELLRRLDDPDEGVRAAAALALLPAFDEPGVCDALLRTLAHPDVDRYPYHLAQRLHSKYEAVSVLAERLRAVCQGFRDYGPLQEDSLYEPLEKLAVDAYLELPPAERDAVREALATFTRAVTGASGFGPRA